MLTNMTLQEVGKKQKKERKYKMMTKTIPNTSNMTIN